MAKRTGNQSNAYLKQRGGTYHYQRNVPVELHKHDPRAPRVRKALGTSDIHEARLERDKLAAADDAMWRALSNGVSAKDAQAEYDAVMRFKRVLGVPSATTGKAFPDAVAAALVIEHFTGRKPEAMKLDQLEVAVSKTKHLIREAQSEHTPPPATVRKAFEAYVNDIVHAELRDKSPGQRDKWKSVKQRAVDSFVRVVGNLPLLEITRQDAIAFFDHWKGRIERKEVGENAANRELSNMRTLWRRYADHLQHEGRNPFERLSFKEPKIERRRPAFSVEWLKGKFLAPGAFDACHPEIKNTIMVMIETGARPSEILNLESEHIRLDDPIPHIQLRWREGRELKTGMSQRDIPLIGCALEAMKQQRRGFPVYKDRESNWSAAANKFMADHGLKETNRHTAYCIRHTFEDRLKETGCDLELRTELFGHSFGREKYGAGFSVVAKLKVLEKMRIS